MQVLGIPSIHTLTNIVFSPYLFFFSTKQKILYVHKYITNDLLKCYNAFLLLPLCYTLGHMCLFSVQSNTVLKAGGSRQDGKSRELKYLPSNFFDNSSKYSGVIPAPLGHLLAPPLLRSLTVSAIPNVEWSASCSLLSHK